MGSVTSDVYFERPKHHEIKGLIEEEWPLATLGKILYHPHREIAVEYYGPHGGKGYDASFRFNGSQCAIDFFDEYTPIEITTAYSKTAHEERRDLVKRMRGEETEISMKVTDWDSDFIEISERTYEAIQNKYLKTYPPNTWLLVSVFFFRGLGSYNQLRLEKYLREKLSEIKYRTIILDTFHCTHFTITRRD